MNWKAGDGGYQELVSVPYDCDEGGDKDIILPDANLEVKILPEAVVEVIVILETTLYLLFQISILQDFFGNFNHVNIVDDIFNVDFIFASLFNIIVIILTNFRTCLY